MSKQWRLLVGVSLLWLPLSMLFDGINTLVLPVRLSAVAGGTARATQLGLISFVGLIIGALLQPLAGALSDRLQGRISRMSFIGAGVLLTLGALLMLLGLNGVAGLTLGYLLVQAAAGVTQAGQQALIPDMVTKAKRGTASGMKGFMDLAGAMLGFVLLGRLLQGGQAVPAISLIGGSLVLAYLAARLLTPRAEYQAVPAKAKPASLSTIFSLHAVDRSSFLRLLAVRFLFLLGIYAIGRFLLLFVAERLAVPEAQAAEQAGNLLALLALITVLASGPAGWLADRYGRRPLMLAGGLLGGISSMLLIPASSAGQILLAGSLMSLGSAAFSGGSWALLADIVPKGEPARYFGISNFSTVGAAAAAGLFGPLIDLANSLSAKSGFNVLFAAAGLAFFASGLLTLRLPNPARKETRDERETDRDGRQVGAGPARLAVLPIPADPAVLEEDQDPPGGTA